MKEASNHFEKYINILLFLFLTVIISYVCNISYNFFLLFFLIFLIFNINFRLIYNFLKIILRYYYNPKKGLHLSQQIFDAYQSSGFYITRNFSKIPDKPTIFICPYITKYIEYPLMYLIPRNLAVIMVHETGKILEKIMPTTIIHRYSYSNNYDSMNSQIVEKYKDGYCIFCYVTKPSRSKRRLGKMFSGIFNIAKKNNITMTPIVFSRIENMSSLSVQNIRMKVGETFLPDNIVSNMIDTKNFFNKTLRGFSTKK